MPRVVLILASFAVLLDSLCRAASGPSGNESGANPQANASVNAAERARLVAALVAETNRVRRAHGLATLQAQPALNAAADDQAWFMTMTTGASHLSPIRGQRTPSDRVARHGVQPAMVAENLAWYPVGSGDEPPPAEEIAAALVEQWMSSPGHRANLLSKSFTQFGVAVRLARVLGRAWCAYGVQVFVVPRPGTRLGS